MFRDVPWVWGFLTCGWVSKVEEGPPRFRGPRSGGRRRGAYFYFEEVLWWAVDLLEALLAGIGHGLHTGLLRAKVRGYCAVIWSE
jgi:hypothetical protein